MAHDLFGIRYIGRKVAWHNLGTTFAEGSEPTLVEAFKMGKLDYEFIVETPYAIAEGTPVYFENDRAIIRKPTDDDPVYRPIAIVSDEYSLLQNMEIAQIFNELSKKWKVETCGALGKGEKIFATLDCGMVDIGGEPVHKFWILNENHVAGGMTNLFFCPYQVVCANTLRSGLAQSKTTIKIKHDKYNKEKLVNTANIIEELIAKEEMMIALFGDMCKVRFPVEKFEEMVNTMLFPFPDKPEESDQKKIENWLKTCDKQKSAQLDLKELYEEYSDTRGSGLAESLFGAVSAVCDYTDFGMKGRGTSQYEKAIFGGDRSTIKEYAFAYAVDYMK